MAILVTCSACGAKLRVRDEYLGKDVWCPSCKAPLTLTGERVPNHEVFVSYSNKDKAVADAICATLEDKHIRCWIAPRDISAGNSWGGSIIEAIEDAQVMVLVYSAYSNLSPQIIREVERAVAKGLLIVPFRIEAAPMSKDMEYFLSSSHWFDALTPPLEKHLAQFAEMVRLILFKNAKAKTISPSTDRVSAASPRANTLPWKSAATAVIGVALALGVFLGVRQYQQTRDVGTPSPANRPLAVQSQIQTPAGPSASINAIARTIPAEAKTRSAPATVQASLVMPPPRPVETPATSTTPAAKMGGAAITISCSQAVSILPLEIGQRTFNDSEGSRPIKSISPELSGWQFVCVPHHTINPFEIRVNQDGVLYAFGGGNTKTRTAQAWLGAEEVGKWEAAEGAISGSFNFCFRRKVTAGERIKLAGMSLQLAARSIELVQSESVPQPTAAAPAAFAVAPVAAGVSAAKMQGAAVTITCSVPVRISPLQAEQPSSFGIEHPGKIKRISPELDGWQFVCVPHHTTESYEIRVIHDGILVAFGNNNTKRTTAHWLVPGEFARWESVDGLIGGDNDYCLRRKVTAGETIKLTGFAVHLAAKNIEYLREGEAKTAMQPVAPLPPSSTPAAQPGPAWTNGLGMIFVTVPGTAVQFSIWDTRVQDYQAFVTATGRSWGKPNFEQGPTHPAVMVSWNDAKVFCAWLTERERLAGTLTSTQEYRLPTDLEWSAAVGLENETGSTPKERNGGVEGVYPWGSQWPPPRGAGNYAKDFKVDDFAHTSPVGSFAANQFGLYDMGGNVTQWCADLYGDDEGVNRVVRGTTCHATIRTQLLSSYRDKTDPVFRFAGWGFRCVLAGTGASAPR